MYKVFFNDRVINIVAPGKITLNKPTQNIRNIDTKSELKKWFKHFLKSDFSEEFLLNEQPDKFFDFLFPSIFKTIHAAGGIVNRNDELLFIYRNEKWDLPKGKIDKGEDANEAALREVEEECGIYGHKIVKKLPSTFHIYQSPYKKSKGEWILKKTYWFEMKYGKKDNGKPQVEENITEIKWLKKEEFKTVMGNTYSNLIPLIRLYLD